MNKNIARLIWVVIFVGLILKIGWSFADFQAGWLLMHNQTHGFYLHETLALFFRRWPIVSVLFPPLAVLFIGWLALRTKREWIFELVIGIALTLSVAVVLILTYGVCLLNTEAVFGKPPGLR